VAAERDLFTAALEERLAQKGPLAARMRPNTLDDIVGQRHLLGPGKPLRSLIEADRLSSIILWGPPGTGKTTLANVIATTTHRHYVPLSAVSAGVKDVREAVDKAQRLLADHDQGTILFLDEVHRFNKAQQDALLPAVESGILTLIGATTENPFFEVNAPLMSRSTLFRLEPLAPDDLAGLLRRAIEFEGHSPGADDDAVTHLAQATDGDARAALTTLEVALAIAGPDTRVTIEHIEQARSSKVLRYGEDEHYDVISAFIKSIRGSDPDAGLYWLARMLEAGEDARFIARRLVILASEDVGLADSMGLVVANAAAHAVEYAGLPEAQLNLAHAVIYLATAPKSGAVKNAIGKVFADVRERPAGRVPSYLRQVHPYQRNRTKEGTGYLYPHDYPEGWVEQEYRPEEVSGRIYYEPTDHGEEAEIGANLRRRPPPPEDGS
jgi:putative ATPase